jgi:hypothetical protein
MISAVLFAISTLTGPVAACSPPAISCAAPDAAYSDRPILRAKGVVAARGQNESGASADNRAATACHPHPTRNPACRHRQTSARIEAMQSKFALEEAHEVQAR